MTNKSHTALSGYDYFAFISYSRKDEKWAKWLQQKLETYHLPMVSRNDVESLPKKIHPIFRDRTDLTTGSLRDALHKELDVSKKLILICSPNSASSPWVNKEAQRFIDLGRYGDIIPFIVAGRPGGGEDECFPEALREQGDEQLLGVSVAELGRRDAFLRLVAGMLDIKFDQLKRRHEQRQKKRRMISGALAILFLTVSCVASFKLWDYYVPHEAYFADYALRWGVPEGIGPLTKQETAKRSSHYIIVTERGHVSELIHANSAGSLAAGAHTEYLDRPVISRFYYRDNGKVEYAEYKDHNGKIVSARSYTTDLKAVDFHVSREDSSFQTTLAATTSIETGMFGLRLSSTQSEAKSDITRHVFEYNGDGYVTKAVYMRDNHNTPRLDADGIGGLSYTLDKYGRPVEIRYLDLNGKDFAATKRNVAGKRYNYDGYNLVKTEYINPDGDPTLNEQGWMVREADFDPDGNVVSERFLDAKGLPIPQYGGYSSRAMEYGERGNRTGEKYFGADGKLVLCSEGFASVTFKYDERGNITGEAYFDAGGKPVLCSDGFASVVFKYDERGNIIGEAFFDADGKPALRSDGFASRAVEYDERGNITGEAFFDADGKPALRSDGFASRAVEYDERGNITGEAFFDADGKPALCSEGFASLALKYDERGNIISEAFFDADGKPVLREDGYASWTVKYDERGNIISEAFFDADGKPVLREDGYASWTVKYDERGNITSEAFFGADGKPALREDGYASREIKYDERGNKISEAFFDAGGKPALCTNGYASWTIEYDKRGNIIGAAYFGADGKPVLCTEGFASLASEYDKRGNKISEAYSGADGKPILCTDGYASVVSKYDGRGNKISEAFFDAGGKPVLCTDGYASWEVEYDGRGNRISAAYFGADNKPVLHKNGYSSWSVEYDEHGSVISRTYFDADGKPVLK